MLRETAALPFVQIRYEPIKRCKAGEVSLNNSITSLMRRASITGVSLLLGLYLLAGTLRRWRIAALLPEVDGNFTAKFYLEHLRRSCCLLRHVWFWNVHVQLYTIQLVSRPMAFYAGFLTMKDPVIITAG
jgi:hypothetical protein